VLQSANFLTPVERARWLAELAATLTDARELLCSWSAQLADPRVLPLTMRIDAALMEIDALRRGGWAPALKPAGPEWSMSLPWRRNPALG